MSLEPYDASKWTCANAIEQLQAQKNEMKALNKLITSPQSAASSKAIACMLSAIEHAENALKCFLEYDDGMDSQRR